MTVKEKYNIYIDESGDPIFSNGSSKYLVFSAVIVNAGIKNSISTKIDTIKKKFGLNELKSSSRNLRNERKRIQIFEEINNLDFKVLTLFILKNKVLGEWRLNKKVFYKFTQKIINSELHKIFENKTIVLDRFGSDKYQKSLKNYLDKQLELFDETVIIKSAKNESLIQLADLFSGTFRKFYLKEFKNTTFFKNLFNYHNLRLIIFPNDLLKINFKQNYSKEDEELSKITISQAEQYLKEIEHNKILEPNKIVLEYLLFHAKYNDKKIYTPELIDWLKFHGHKFSEENFRGNIIGKLRDNGVIIAGSRSGIKLPISSRELTEYFSFTSNMILPMINRLSISFDVLNSRSSGTLSILKNENFDLLKKLFEVVREHKINS